MRDSCGGQGDSAIAAKKQKQPNLEIIAGQLAKVHVLPLVDGDHITLRATAQFTTRSFTAGEYEVFVGVDQALLHLDHPSYEREHPYQATLPKNTWSQSWINRTSSHSGIGFAAKIGAKIADVLGLSSSVNAGTENRETTEQKAQAPYPLITATPTGWRIGTEMGDPRTPEKALPQGLEHCLDGEYFSGRRSEQGDGYKESNGQFALGILKARPGGNDPRVVATLIGVSSALRIAVKLGGPMMAPGSGLKPLSDSKKKEHELRQAFIEICLRRAKEAHEEHARTNTMLSGEFYLHRHETHTPKLSQGASLEPGIKNEGKPR